MMPCTIWLKFGVIDFTQGNDLIFTLRGICKFF